MDDRGTISTGDIPSAVVVPAGTNLGRVPFGVRNTLGGEASVGRRVGREEKDLILR